MKSVYRGLRFGVATLQHLPWKQTVKCWKFIEALGFDSAGQVYMHGVETY